MPLLFTFTGLGAEPRLLTATAIASDRVRLVFNEAMRSNAALILPGNYVVTPDLGSDPRTVVSVSVAGPLTVDLQLDGDLTVGTLNYAVTVSNVEDLAGNVIDPAFDTADFSGLQTDFIPPYLVNLSPADGEASVAVSSNIQFDVLDDDEGVDLATLDVTVDVDGVPTAAVLAGVIQAPFTGSVTPVAGGYTVLLDPASDFTPTSTVTVSVTADDLAAVPNSLTDSYSFFTFFSEPTARLRKTLFHALVGSIIQLDARDSTNVDSLPMTFEWQYVSVPIGSVLEPDVGLPNPASITAIREGYRAVSFIPDKVGRYVVGLTAIVGSSVSSITAEVNIGLSLVPCGEGVVPDARFIWQFLSNFWNLVEDREMFQVLWSAAIQIVGAELTKLWSTDYDKSLKTIQGIVTRRWQRFRMLTEIGDRPHTVIVGNNTGGTDGLTGTGTPSPSGLTRVFRVPIAGEDFTAIDVNFGAGGRIISINGQGFTVDRVFNNATHSVVQVTDEAVTDAMVSVAYALPHMLYVPGLDLEAEGVSPGDVLVFDVERKDTGQRAELRARISAVDGERVGFELTLAQLAPGVTGTVDHALFRQLVVDLRVISPIATDDDIAAVAEAFIQFVPTGINLATRPFSTFQVVVRAREIIHNSSVKVDDLLVSVPHLQHELKVQPAVIYVENTDFILQNGYLAFTSGLFTATDPAPDELWAECVHVDNSPTVERNFGHLVNLEQDDLVAKATRAPYLAAVRGLWFAVTGSPDVANLRLALQILMGLPFTEERGVVIAITTGFTTDTQGNVIGRILMEDVDDQDRKLGSRRFYYYPEAIGLETNPATGQPIAVGDIIDAFFPLSEGAVVEDYVTNPLWWTTNQVRGELQKFHLWRAQIDTETGVFDENDLVFSIQFLRSIRPAWTDIVAAVLLRLQDDDVLDNFSENITGSSPILRFYDAAGAYGGHESTPRADDNNHQAAELWLGDGRPFSTRSLALLRDVVTAQNGASVEATSAAGFGPYRARNAGDLTHPTVEGDLLGILQGQPGGGGTRPALYEITAGTLSVGPLTLGNFGAYSDPATWDAVVPDSALFPYGTGLRATVLRRAQNPVVRGTDLQTVAGAPQIANAAAGNFLQNGVAIDDHLVIESGANEGEYRIIHTNAQTTPRDYTDPPQIGATQVGLVNLDGTNPALADLSGQDYRIVRPAFMRNRVERARVVQSGGDMFAEVLDFGAATEVPFDVFTPGMVGRGLNVAQAQNPLNDGDYTVLEYVHAGRVRITTGAPQTSDSSPDAVLTISSPYHPGFERADDLAPFEVFGAVVT